MSRQASNRLLWGAVKRIAFGEEEMRTAVTALNVRDGTNAAVVGTESYGSTKLLTEAQLAELAEDFRKRANLPPPSRQPAGPRGGRARRPVRDTDNVVYIASRGEAHYVGYLFGLLGFAEEKIEAFIERQTKGAGLATHAACNQVIAPLESMARRRGFQIVERDRIKRVIAPTAGDT